MWCLTSVATGQMSARAPRQGELVPTGIMITSPETRFTGDDAIGGDSAKPTYFDDEWKMTDSTLECNEIRTLIEDPIANRTTALYQDSHFRVTHMFTGSTELWGEKAIAFEPMTGRCRGFACCFLFSQNPFFPFLSDFAVYRYNIYL